jgi:1-acyl-sn-glycerol-3-phosphate acyltransferase
VLLSGVVIPLTRFVTSLSVRGAHTLRRETTMIFAANHTSHLDTPIVLAALPSYVRRRTVVAAAMDTFFLKATEAATTVLTFNAIPIERHKVNRRSAETALTLLKEGGTC